MKKTSKMTLAAAAAVATAAFSGLLAGSASASTPMNGIHQSSLSVVAEFAGTYAANAADAGKHGCKGQNACKGQGGCKTDKNDCKGHNACKGQGGCATDGSHK